MARLVCGGCHTLLMYIRGATSVQCSCCHTVNLALEGKKIVASKLNKGWNHLIYLFLFCSWDCFIWMVEFLSLCFVGLDGFSTIILHVRDNINVLSKQPKGILWLVLFIIFLQQLFQRDSHMIYWLVFCSS